MALKCKLGKPSALTKVKSGICEQLLFIDMFFLNHHCKSKVKDNTLNTESQPHYCVIFSETLPKPSISISPAGNVTWGQDVSINCSISAELLGGTFILKKTSGSFRKIETSSTNSATFRILKVNFDNEELYWCQFEKSISSQSFSSPLSDSVRLLVTGKKNRISFLNLMFYSLVNNQRK